MAYARPSTIGSAWKVALTAALWLGAVGSTAEARRPPPRYPVLRPRWEYTSWVGVGGGALVGPEAAPSVFDLRVGGDATVAIGALGDLRVGPFAEVATANFGSLRAAGGVELFVGGVPRPLRMFLYPGEGVFAARLGAGWAWRTGDLPGPGSTPIASLTVAYGYRAPFSLREVGDEYRDEPNFREPGRYMTGARLWAGATVDLHDAPTWQVTGGIEFEPVGTFRYLLGLY